MSVSRKSSAESTQVTSMRGMWYGIAFVTFYCALIYVLRPLMPQIDFAEDTGFSHYYWKLPNPTAITRATAWGGYLLHQVANWYLIYYAQKNNIRYTSGLHKVNLWALGLNAFFILLHLFQTAIWYDGLAQDTHILSSQGAVILLLVMVLLMENQRRGLFFGKKIKVLNKPGKLVRYYHGYIFSWAVIYTFWYHPMESTSGHLIGTFYTLLIMLQGSLFFTRIHVNKWWMFFQEFLVLIHGTLVAFMNHARQPESTNMWKMFFFGFAAMVVVTQMYGLGLKKWQRWAINIGFIGLVMFFYRNDYVATNEIIRIPFIEYLSVFVLAGILWIGIGIQKLFKRDEQLGAVSAD